MFEYSTEIKVNTVALMNSNIFYFKQENISSFSSKVIFERVQVCFNAKPIYIGRLDRLRDL
jgi:hypothetical protein